MNEVKTRTELIDPAGLATLQRGSSSSTANSGRLAGHQPGFSATSGSRLAGLQPGSSATNGSSRLATLPASGLRGSIDPVSAHAGLEPGEPSGELAAESAGLEPGEPSSGSAGKGARLEPGEPSSELKWSDRGYMPHVDGAQLIQHVSYHLADSLPKEALEVMSAELKRLPPKLRDAEKEKRIAAYVDAGKGSCVLRVPEIAAMVQNAFMLFHGERYTLHAWCVMPNHVHVLFQPKQGWSMSKIVASWKSYTGRRISEYVKRAGQAEGQEPVEPSSKPTSIWHREYWDRYIRDHAHYVNVVKYIHENPVKAGLVKKAEKWKWSSAGLATLQRGPSGNAGLEPGEPTEE